MTLTDAKAKAAKPKDKQYKLSDSGGLYLLVMPNGSKYWRQKYRFGGKEKTLAIGTYSAVSLKAARDAAITAKKLLANGKDPVQEKRDARIKRSAESSTFGDLAELWAASKLANASDSHKERTLGIIHNHLYPTLRNRNFGAIKVPDLDRVLESIQSKGLIDTAHRARSIYSQIARLAIRKELADTDVAAPLKGGLREKPAPKHYAAFTNAKDVGRLMVAIHAFDGSPVVSAALKFSPLTLARPGEIRHAEWSEISESDALWLIPASKMKGGSDHMVPLSEQALEILREIHPLTGRGKYVFPSARGQGRPMSENAVRVALRTLGFTNDEMTAHGFRAMGRTLLDETPEIRIRPEVIEMQLAHTVKDPLGNAYSRAQFLDDRRAMLQKWANYLDELRAAAESSTVVIGEFAQK